VKEFCLVEVWTDETRTDEPEVEIVEATEGSAFL
jgi:hypothetical protein